ncbi:MAG: tRNA (adenosine(37)-N6)-dimethylallyltransferase MiaA [Candidatus Curtissbacteria bacterium]|nr:tRNA (adenosine(37)-N6)-dimethylallyltransferase MiaA [Candidatus Curtissbacteria bacterium]
MLVVFGPTSTGKTNLAISLAKKFNGELISADSRQVYKNLDIGTGKVSPESKIKKHSKYWKVDGIKIHGFDLVEPGDCFTVFDFLKFATDKINDLKKQQKLPIIVGGTAFYINALLKGVDTEGIAPNYKLRSVLEKLSIPDLYKKLLNINPQKATSLNQSDKNNPRRLIRAIEINLSKVNQHKSPRPITERLLTVGLTAPNDYLYTTADKWLKARLDQGMIQEVGSLIKSGVNGVWLDNLGLEYRWITRYIQGQISLDDALERLKGDIHGLIRRQKTWFPKFEDMKVFDITNSNWRQELEKTISLQDLPISHS